MFDSRVKGINCCLYYKDCTLPNCTASYLPHVPQLTHSHGDHPPHQHTHATLVLSMTRGLAASTCKQRPSSLFIGLMPLLAIIRPCGVFSSTHQITLAQNYVKIRKQAIADQKHRKLSQSGLLDSLLLIRLRDLSTIIIYQN